MNETLEQIVAEMRYWQGNADPTVRDWADRIERAAARGGEAGDWVLVPRKMTSEMAQAAWAQMPKSVGYAGRRAWADEAYAAMLTAIPPPPRDAGRKDRQAVADVYQGGDLRWLIESPLPDGTKLYANTQEPRR